MTVFYIIFHALAVSSGWLVVLVLVLVLALILILVLGLVIAVRTLPLSAIRSGRDLGSEYGRGVLRWWLRVQPGPLGVHWGSIGGPLGCHKGVIKRP